MLNGHKKLVIDQLPERFNEGLFWGNGFIGGLLYVAGNSLRFSVDHVKLWETRDTTGDAPGGMFSDFIKNPEKFHNGSYFIEKNTSFPRIWRTRLPGLSLNIALEDEITGFYGELDFDTGSSDIVVTLKNKTQVKCFVYLDSNVNVLKVELDAVDSNIEIKGWDTADGNLPVLAEWNYNKYTEEMTGQVKHVIQPYSGKGLAVISLIEKQGNVYISLNAEILDNDNADAGINAGMNQIKRELIDKNNALLNDYTANEELFRKAHKDSWKEFFGRFDVKIPNDRLQHAFYMEMYKIYANERRGSWPVTLQGIWNNDARMPAWYGDWHNDLNIQACYWPAYKTNNAMLADSYIDYYTKCMPRLMERAYQLFGIENAVHCPVMMGPDGYGAGGEWCFWNTLLGPELFVAADFCWYYEYTRNLEKLEFSVYPFLERVINLYVGIAYEGVDGYLHIPFTNSPEVFKGSMMIKDDATVVISTLHYLLGRMAEYAVILGIDNKNFIDFKNKLTPIKTTEKGYPLFPDEDVFESHRHFCQLFPVFPLGIDTHSITAENTLNAVINMGFMEYAAWSFPYLSIFASRCGRGNMARTMLEIYCMAFQARNTFVVNGDPNQNGILKISDTNAGEKSDAFTLEAGFMVPAAISEMFVHRSNDIVYIGYGIPDEWKECSCKNMTIEGGHKVSIEIKDYAVSKVKIEAGCDEVLEISFAKAVSGICLNGEILKDAMTKVNDKHMFEVKKGQTYIFLTA